MLQETKDVAILVARVMNGVGKSLEDGKFGFDDLISFAPVVAAIPAALAKCSDIPAEIKAATDADKEDLYNAFAKEFSISQANAEAMVEKTLEILVAVWKYIK